MGDEVIGECPLCGAHTVRHCDSPTCTWWSCLNVRHCDTFGDDRRHATRGTL